MKDQIIGAYLKDFTDQFGLATLAESEAFEQFVNYCVVSKHHPDAFEPEDVSAGGSGDLGLDGIAIIVNDHLVFSNNDVEHLKKVLRRLDVRFIFTQSKTSSHFDGADIGTFFNGVRQFFGRSEPVGANADILALFRLKDYIFKCSIDMDHSPVCSLYYATTGSWNEDVNLRARANQGVQDLRDTGLFSAVEFFPIDAEALKRSYRELHHKIVREFAFEKHTILPQITGVQEAYIGIVPCLEYLRLICDDDGSLNRRLFYDNVRDFQGHNPVNREIEATVQESSKNDRFALLNNGVTIVAHDANKIGATFRLKDYQIVNGCQTTHILYRNRSHLTPNVYLPLKLIVTSDSEVTNQIIQGTNRQTEVLLEAFESLAPFQKNLEEFYSALGRDRVEPLYYERRSKQYEHLGVRRERIITLATQVKCFVSMFLNEPHSTHRYYGEILHAYRSRVFSESHSAMPYYVSGTAFATLERLFAENKLKRSWKQFKHQMLMVFRIQNEPEELPFLNTKAIEKYCQALLGVLQDDSKALKAFEVAGELIEVAVRKTKVWREPPARTKIFTTDLIAATSEGKAERAGTTVLSSGTVKWFSEIRGYGFILGDDGVDAFVHHTGLLGGGYRWLMEGDRVTYTTTETVRGIQAVDVAKIPSDGA